MNFFSKIIRETRGVFLGITAYVTALTIIQQYKLWKYVAQSAFMAFGTFVLLGVMGWIVGDQLHQLLLSVGWIPEEQGWVYWLTYVLILLPMVLLFVLMYKAVFQVVVAPLLGKVIERVLEIRTGTPWNTRFSLNVAMQGFLKIGLSLLWKEVVLVTALFFLSFIPVLAMITTPLMFIVSSYFLGASSMDMINETLKKTMEERKDYAWKHTGHVMGNGAGFILLFMIPVAGTFLAPVLSVIAASCSYEKVSAKK